MTNISIEEKLKQLEALVRSIDPSELTTKELTLLLHFIHWDMRRVILKCEIDPFDDGERNLGNW